MEAPVAESEALPQSLAEIFEPVPLEILNQIASVSGFSIKPHPNASPNDPSYMTNMRRRIIYYNPLTINTWPEYRKFACFAHELGHHYPPVKKFQDGCENFKDICVSYLVDIIPDQRLCRRIVDDAINILADIFLESVIPQTIITGDFFSQCFRQNRGTMFLEYGNEDIKEALAGLMERFETSGRQKFPWDKEILQAQSPLDQFFQLSLVAPFFDLPPPDYVHEKVAALYPNLQSIFSRLQNTSVPPQHKCAELVNFVKCIVELLKDEADKIKNSDDINSAYCEFTESLGGSLVRVERVTTPGEKAGGENDSDLHDINDEENRGQTVIEIRGDLLKRLNQRGTDAADEIIAEKARELGVSPESYRRYLETCKHYAKDIAEFTTILTELVLRQFRMDFVPNQKNGFMVTPGREAEAYQRRIGGEVSPPTDIVRAAVRNPKTLQLCFLIDTSSSMLADLEATLGYYTVFSCSAMNIHGELRRNRRKYKIGRNIDAPIEIEMIGFDSLPFFVIELTSDVTLRKLVQGYEAIIKRTTEGGATDDARALKFAHNRMRLRNPRCVKMLSMLTDGYGLGEGIEPVLRQIEEDRGIYFMVNGIGKNADAVKQYYYDRFRPSYHYHVFAAASKTVEDAFPKNKSFLIDCIRTQFPFSRRK